MKNRKMKTITAAAVAILVMIGNVSFAQQGRGDGYGRRDGKGRAFQDRTAIRGEFNNLELTDEQKSKIEEIRLDNSKESLALQNQIREKEARLTTLITEDKPDKSEINVMIEAIGKLKTQSRTNRIDTQLEIRDLLTEKQKILFDRHLANRPNRGGRGSRGCGI